MATQITFSPTIPEKSQWFAQTKLMNILVATQKFGVLYFNNIKKDAQSLSFKQSLQATLTLKHIAKAEHQKYVKNAIIISLLTTVIFFSIIPVTILAAVHLGASLYLTCTIGALVALTVSAIAFPILSKLIQNRVTEHKQNYNALIEIIKNVFNLDLSCSSFSAIEKNVILKYLDLLAEKGYLEIGKSGSDLCDMTAQLSASSVIHPNLFEIGQFILNNPQNLEKFKRIFAFKAYKWGFRPLMSLNNALHQSPLTTVKDSACELVKIAGRLCYRETPYVKLSEIEKTSIRRALDILANSSLFSLKEGIDELCHMLDHQLKNLIDDLCNGDFKFNHFEMAQFILNDPQNFANLKKIFNSPLYKYGFKIFMRFQPFCMLKPLKQQ
jgi:hypothetical protein